MYNSTGGGTASPAADERLTRSHGIAYVSASVVEFLVIIIGNFVALAVFGKNRQLRQRKSHWLIIHQTLIDLLAGIMMGPLWIYYLTREFDILGHGIDLYLQITEVSILLLFTSASGLNLLMISLERMSATHWPIKHRTLSARSYRVAIGLVWSVSLALPSARATQLLDQISLSTYHYTQISFVCCGLLLIVLSYVSIWIRLKCFSHPQNNLRAVQERKLTASLFLVTVASLMTFLPGTVTVALPATRNSISVYSARHVQTNGYFLVYANFMINPIVYAFRMPGFRRAAVRLVCGRPRTENQALPMQSPQPNRANFHARPATLQWNIIPGKAECYETRL